MKNKGREDFQTYYHVLIEHIMVRYHITTDDIEAWQNTLSAVSFPIHSVLLTPSFTEQLTPLISRFAAGQMDVKTLLQKLNDTARMVEYELQ